MQGLRSPTGCTSRSSGRRRPLETPWGGEVGTVAVARPEAWRRWRSGEVRKGIGEGGEVDLGEGRRSGEREGQVGGMGGGRGVGAALSSPVAGEGVRRGPAPVPTPVGGTGKGRATRGGGLGRLGLGSAQLGQGPVGGLLLLLFFLCLFCFLLYFLFIYLFSFLFYFI